MDNARLSDEHATEENEKPSLREITRAAYSKASLHNYKSDPLHRRKDSLKPGKAPKNGHTARESAGSKRGRGGQPNMKLRMGALLERIKRDFS